MVRLATLDDIDAIKNIADKHTREIGFVLRPALIEHCRKGTLLVAVIDNSIIGFCNYHRRKDNISTIYEICVDDNYRNKGIARNLINEVPKPIQLKCSVDNESNIFYQKIGACMVDTLPGKKRNLNLYHIGFSEDKLF